MLKNLNDELDIYVFYSFSNCGSWIMFHEILSYFYDKGSFTDGIILKVLITRKEIHGPSL